MTGEIEILPPEPKAGAPARVRYEIVEDAGPIERFQPTLPGSPVKSGHWWLFVEGRGNALQGSAPPRYVELRLNGQTLQFPIGVWAVVDNHKFHVAKDSDLPMLWFDGDTLMEKTFDTRKQGRSGLEFNVIGQRPADSSRARHALARTQGLLPEP